MAISADASVIPAFVSASFTFSSASGGVTMYHAEPSSFRSSAPASSTRSSSLSSLAASLGTEISPLRWNIPPDGAGFGHVAAVLAHEMAELTDHAVAVGSDNLNQHAHSTWAISFEGGFLILLAFQLAGAAKNGALDVFTWHVRSLCRQNRSSQARVGVWFASADARRNADFSDDSREYAAALRVGGPFLMFNRGPF